jgi:hypothetical protein
MTPLAILRVSLLARGLWTEWRWSVRCRSTRGVGVTAWVIETFDRADRQWRDWARYWIERKGKP